MDDAVEQGLLDAIAREPYDDFARQVYADWLEQHGWPVHARYLRLDAIDATAQVTLASAAAATPIDALFRAALTRTRVAACIEFEYRCPRRWHTLRRTADPRVRFCDHCSRDVTMAQTVDEARDLARRRECIAIDAALVRDDTVAAFDADWRAPRPKYKVMGMASVWPDTNGVEPPLTVPARPNPDPAPSPLPAPPKPPLLARIARWFTK